MPYRLLGSAQWEGQRGQASYPQSSAADPGEGQRTNIGLSDWSPPDTRQQTLVDFLGLRALPVLSTTPPPSGALESTVQSTKTNLTREVARLHSKPVYGTCKEAGGERTHACLPGIPSLLATSQVLGGDLS